MEKNPIEVSEVGSGDGVVSLGQQDLVASGISAVCESCEETSKPRLAPLISDDTRWIWVIVEHLFAQIHQMIRQSNEKKASDPRVTEILLSEITSDLLKHHSVGQKAQIRLEEMSSSGISLSGIAEGLEMKMLGPLVCQILLATTNGMLKAKRNGMPILTSTEKVILRALTSQVVIVMCKNAGTWVAYRKSGNHPQLNFSGESIRNDVEKKVAVLLQLHFREGNKTQHLSLHAKGILKTLQRASKNKVSIQSAEQELPPMDSRTCPDPQAGVQSPKAGVQPTKAGVQQPKAVVQLREAYGEAEIQQGEPEVQQGEAEIQQGEDEVSKVGSGDGVVSLGQQDLVASGISAVCESCEETSKPRLASPISDDTRWIWVIVEHLFAQIHQMIRQSNEKKASDPRVTEILLSEITSDLLKHHSVGQKAQIRLDEMSSSGISLSGIAEGLEMKMLGPLVCQILFATTNGMLKAKRNGMPIFTSTEKVILRALSRQVVIVMCKNAGTWVAYRWSCCRPQLNLFEESINNDVEKKVAVLLQLHIREDNKTQHPSLHAKGILKTAQRASKNKVSIQSAEQELPPMDSRTCPDPQAGVQSPEAGVQPPKAGVQQPKAVVQLREAYGEAEVQQGEAEIQQGEPKVQQGEDEVSEVGSGDGVVSLGQQDLVASGISAVCESCEETSKPRLAPPISDDTRWIWVIVEHLFAQIHQMIRQSNEKKASDPRVTEILLSEITSDLLKHHSVGQKAQIRLEEMSSSGISLSGIAEGLEMKMLGPLVCQILFATTNGMLKAKRNGMPIFTSTEKVILRALSRQVVKVLCKNAGTWVAYRKSCCHPQLNLFEESIKNDVEKKVAVLLQLHFREGNKTQHPSLHAKGLLKTLQRASKNKVSIQSAEQELPPMDSRTCPDPQAFSKVGVQPPKAGVQPHDADVQQGEAEVQQGEAEVQQGEAELQQRQAELQQRQAEVQQSQAELHQRQAEFQQRQAEFQQRQAEFQQRQAEFQQRRAEFQQRRAEFQQRRAEFQQSQAEFQQRQTEFQQSQAEFQQSQAEFQQSQAEFQRSQAEFQQSQTGFQQSQAEVSEVGSGKDLLALGISAEPVSCEATSNVGQLQLEDLKDVEDPTQMVDVHNGAISAMSLVDDEEAEDVEPLIARIQPSKPEVQPPKAQDKPPKAEIEPPKAKVQPPKPEVQPPKPEVHPPKAEVHPPKAEVHPPKAEIEPPKAEVHPPKAEVQPPKAEVQPPKAEVHPPKAEVQPPKAEVHPPKAEVHPPKAEVHPPKAEIEPPKAEVHPPKAEVHPPKAEVQPPK
ncbi:hypothetical protein UPYG_G00024580, partial [Umbra pygmaea]